MSTGLPLVGVVLIGFLHCLVLAQTSCNYKLLEDREINVTASSQAGAKVETVGVVSADNATACIQTCCQNGTRHCNFARFGPKIQGDNCIQYSCIPMEKCVLTPSAGKTGIQMGRIQDVLESPASLPFAGTNSTSVNSSIANKTSLEVTTMMSSAASEQSLGISNVSATDVPVTTGNPGITSSTSLQETTIPEVVGTTFSNVPAQVTSQSKESTSHRKKGLPSALPEPSSPSKMSSDSIDWSSSLYSFHKTTSTPRTDTSANLKTSKQESIERTTTPEAFTSAGTKGTSQDLPNLLTSTVGVDQMDIAVSGQEVLKSSTVDQMDLVNSSASGSSLTTASSELSQTLPSASSDAVDPLQGDMTDDKTLDEPLANAQKSVHLIIALVIGLMLLLTVFGLMMRRCYDNWLRRHYQRMDFLIEGMYNGTHA